MNKTLITFFTILFCLTSSIGWSLTIKDLVVREGLYYKKFSDVPFTGEVTGKEQGLVKNGDLEGLWIGYHDNGQMWYKGTFKKGCKDGSDWKEFWKNGQLYYKGVYKNCGRQGYWVYYDEDGKINNFFTGTYKNDNKID